jgi:hypothetical protein
MSAIVTLPAMPVTRGGAMPAPPAPDSMVRVSEGASGAFAALEVNTAGHWTEVAQLDGVHAEDSVNVVLDQTTPGEERARPTLVPAKPLVKIGPWRRRPRSPWNDPQSSAETESTTAK